MNKAILVIDVQNVMFDYEGGVFEKEKVISNIKKVIEVGRSKDIPIIYIQHQSRGEGFLKQDTYVWEIRPEISPQQGDPIFSKEACDAFTNPELEIYLKDQGIEELILVGMQTEFCVDTTCRRALSLGYTNTLISDGHSTFNTDLLTAEVIIKHHNDIMKDRFAKVISTCEFTGD